MKLFSNLIDRKHEPSNGSIMELLKKFGTPEKNYFRHFRDLSQQLVNHFIIVKGDSQYSINEIEIYYNNDNDHNDLFAQNNPVQKKIGRWYFHNAGVDITFGNELAFGGILIRGIVKAGDPKFINGPLKVFDELFQDGGSVDGRDINKVFIRSNPKPEQNSIVCGPRAGIRIIASETNVESKQRFLFKPYRFIATNNYPQYSEKYLIGLYQTKILNQDMKKVAAQLLIDKTSLSQYCEQFDKGAVMDLRQIFSMKQSVEKNCMLFGNLAVKYKNGLPV